MPRRYAISRNAAEDDPALDPGAGEPPAVGDPPQGPPVDDPGAPAPAGGRSLRPRGYPGGYQPQPPPQQGGYQGPSYQQQPLANFNYPTMPPAPTFDPNKAPDGAGLYYGQQIGAQDPSMQYIPDLTTNDPNRMYRNVQNIGYNLGSGINADLYNQTQQQYGLYGQYGNLANQAYSQLAQTPGYTQDEQQNIIRQQGYQGAMTTPEQYASLGPTGSESAGMTGDTGSYGDYFNPQQFNDLNQANENMQYANVDRAGAAQQGAIGGLQSAYGQAIDPTKLRTSAGYMQQAGMTDAEVEQAAQAAERNVGTQYGAAMDDVRRRAAASGNASPMAIAAATSRLQNQQSVATADAATDARLAARGQQRQAATGVEQTRLGAEQGLTGMEMGAAGNVAGQQMGAAQYQGGLSQAAQNQILANQMGAAQYTTGMGTSIRQAQDTANTQRAAQLYGIRQGNTQYGQQSTYQQGMGVNQALSAGYANAAQQRMQGQQQYRGFLTGQQGQALGAYQTGQGQRIQNYNALTGGMNANAAQWGNWQLGKASQPTGFQQAVAIGAGALASQQQQQKKPGT